MNRRFLLACLFGGLACTVIGFILYRQIRARYLHGTFDLIILNGVIIDGLGNPPYRADIGIRDGRIAGIGTRGSVTADRTIDAAGNTIAPGFIDVHTHVERNIPERPRPFRAPNFIRQGATTIITGNCGTSVLSVAGLLNRIESHGSEVNLGTLIGHNTVRRKVMKERHTQPNRLEMEAMQKIIRDAMNEGAHGLSTGLAYVPGAYASEGELIALARVVVESGGGLYVSHIRNEGVSGVNAITEALDIGKQAGMPVHISHFKASGRSQWGTAGQRLALVANAIAQGQPVSIDQYPYTASSTTLDLLLPNWALEGNSDQLRRRLQDPVIRTRIRSDMLIQARANGWSDYSFAQIAYCPSDPELNGLTIPEATVLGTHDARQRQWLSKGINPAHATVALRMPITTRRSDSIGRSTNKDYNTARRHNRNEKLTRMERQAEMILDLAASGGAQMIYFDMSDDDVEEIMKYPVTVFGSDSTVREDNMRAMPHPRGLGTFPRVLSHYVRGRQVLFLQEAVRRMTSLPATIFGIKDRGRIAEGCWADLVIFDELIVQDQADYKNPLSHPKGIYVVIVNGIPVFEDGRFTNASPGRSICFRK